MRSLIQRVLTEIPFKKRNGHRDIYVAMSGGVDSSVAAFLLKERGYSVHPIMYKSWDFQDELGGGDTQQGQVAECSFERDVDDVQAVTKALGLQHELRIFDFVKTYWNEVFEPWFLHRLELGYTPSPDLICNRVIKFDAFLHRIRSLTSDPNPLFATGHYARLRFSDPQRLPNLLRAIDLQKDQTYFLAAVPGKFLRSALFPVGTLTKCEVREIARHASIPVAAKRSSRGLCFIGRRRMPDFIARYLPATRSGHFIDFDSNQKLGPHSRRPFQYTVGQGARIGGCDDKYYVVDKVETSDGGVSVIVAKGWDHPALFCRSMICKKPYWIAGDPPAGLIEGKELELLCVTSNRDAIVPCTLQRKDEKSGLFMVRFEKARRRVGRGQAIVFYKSGNAEVCLGGAWIEHSAGLSQNEKNEWPQELAGAE